MMKCFVLLCALAVVGVRARPSTMVTRASGNVEVDDTHNMDIQDFSLDDIKGALTKVLKHFGAATATALALVPLIPLSGKRDISAEEQDVDWDAILGHITSIAGDISNNAVTILPSILGLLGGHGKRGLDNEKELEKLENLLKKFPLGKVEVQDWTATDTMKMAEGVMRLPLVNGVGSALGMLHSVFDIFGKRDISAEEQDVDWDAILGHITSIAGDISNNAVTILPSILGLLGGHGKRGLDNEKEYEKIDNLLKKFPLGKVEVQDWTKQDTMNMAEGALKLHLVNGIGGALGLLNGVFGLFKGKRGLDNVKELEKLDNLLKKLPVEVQDDVAEVVLNTVLNTVGGIPNYFLGLFGIGKRDLPVEVQDVDWDAILGHITSIVGDISTNAATILPSILGALGKREVGDDFDVQDFDFGDFFKLAKQFVPIVNVVPDIGKRDIETEDFDLSDITGALAKISNAWSDIVTNKIGPALAGLGKRDIETQDFDLSDITGALAKISNAWSDIVTNKIGPALAGLPLGALSKLGKRDIETQDFDLEDITGALAKISNAWSDIVTNKIGPALAGLGKRDIETQDFDLSDITGALAKISNAWTEILNTKILPAVAKLPPGTFDKLKELGTKYLNHESLTSTSQVDKTQVDKTE